MYLVTWCLNAWYGGFRVLQTRPQFLHLVKVMAIMLISSPHLTRGRNLDGFRYSRGLLFLAVQKYIGFLQWSIENGLSGYRRGPNPDSGD